MRKIFIDGGANNGNSITLFLNKFPNAKEYEIFSFECNPKLVRILKNKFSSKAKIISLAISNKDSFENFYIGEDVSSTLRSDKISGGISKEKYIKAECVDLSRFIFENFDKDDYIVLKLDIEGSEYDVIPHLIQTGAMKYINELYGEFHYHKLNNITKEHHDELVLDLENSGFKMKNWCAIDNIIEF